ncbi:MAG: hypothetical protein K0R22_3116, partial [Sporomusa sp.]|nr:hypothetical protein [Sporomusa sp.]
VVTASHRWGAMDGRSSRRYLAGLAWEIRKLLVIKTPTKCRCFFIAIMSAFCIIYEFILYLR